MITSINEYKKINETIDSRSLIILFNFIKTSLDDALHFYNNNDFDKTKEYLEDQIESLKQIINKL